MGLGDMRHRGDGSDIQWFGVRAIHGVAGAEQAPVEILDFPAHRATLAHLAGTCAQPATDPLSPRPPNAGRPPRRAHREAATADPSRPRDACASLRDGRAGSSRWASFSPVSPSPAGPPVATTAARRPRWQVVRRVSIAGRSEPATKRLTAARREAERVVRQTRRRDDESHGESHQVNHLIKNQALAIG
jgi:hypothetical protein